MTEDRRVRYFEAAHFGWLIVGREWRATVRPRQKVSVEQMERLIVNVAKWEEAVAGFTWSDTCGWQEKTS